MRKRLVLLPMPNQIMARGSHAMPGTDLNRWIKGSMTAQIREDRPDKIPVGMPISDAMAKPAMTLDNDAEAWRTKVPE